MPRERVFFGYDAVDNAYFATKVAEIRKQKAESAEGNAETLKAEMLKAEEQKAEGGKLETGVRPPSSVLCLQHGLPERYFLASARFIEKKNLVRLIQAYDLYRKKAETLKTEKLKGDTGKAESAGRHAETLNAETLKADGPWDLVLLGDGPLRGSLNSQLSTLNLHHCVHLPGFKQYPDLPTYYGLASAFIHASTTEQWGLVVNEAMASGLPVLVSNRCGCAPDLVQDGVNGFTFDPLDVDQLAQLMLKLSTLNSQLSTMGAASQRIISDWGPERFASGLRAAVNKALEVGPATPTLLQRAILQMLLRR
jgi:glycosyltransferase involved in cell wall biosynthesis